MIQMHIVVLHRPNKHAHYEKVKRASSLYKQKYVIFQRRLFFMYESFFFWNKSNSLVSTPVQPQVPTPNGFLAWYWLKVRPRYQLLGHILYFSNLLIFWIVLCQPPMPFVKDIKVQFQSISNHGLVYGWCKISTMLHVQ